MAFLVPAVLAAVCEIVILDLLLGPPPLEDNDMESMRSLYRYRYVLPLSLARAFLLIGPLAYRSYTGTAVRCPLLLLVFYYGSAIFLFCHMLALCIANPTSLTSLIPSSEHAHAHFFRRLWLALILSFTADLCHLLLFLHVRSTAPHNIRIDHSSRPKVLFYFVREQGEDSEMDTLLNRRSDGPRDQNMTLQRQDSSDSINHRLQSITNDFVSEMQQRIQQMKKEWTKRLEAYQSAMQSAAGGASNQDLHHGDISPFNVLLQLFAYENVVANGTLETVYASDEGASLMFFIPQLLSFLLHGAYECSTELEDWILEVCGRNIFFAHKCYWFLRAWCLEVHEPPDKQRISRSNSAASLQGLKEQEEDRSFSSLDFGKAATQKLMPEERFVLEGLMIRVMEKGEQGARLLQFGAGHESHDYTPRTSLGSLTAAVESGAVPVHPLNGKPSARHWDALTASRHFGFLPLEAATSSLSAPPLGSNFFDCSPLFLDSLLSVADDLFRVPRELRADELVRKLATLECEALPSNVIYIPLRNVFHRVWRIVAEESIAISTKERVPCIVYLEVIEYSKSEVSTTRDVHRLLDRASMSSFPFAGKELDNTLLNNWRFALRDPRRSEAPLEKFAHRVRDSIVKIPINQVKTHMRESISKLAGNHGNIKDMLTVHMPETFDADDDNQVYGGPAPVLQSIVSNDIERGDQDDEEFFDAVGSHSSQSTIDEVSTDHLGTPITPQRLVNEEKLGQWASPSPRGTDRRREMAMDNISEALAVPGIKPGSRFVSRRSESIAASSDSSPLAYGSNGTSTFNRDASLGSPPPSGDGVNDNFAEEGDNLPLSKEKVKKPPVVVFKEKFKQKEERIRRRSAMGGRPGWRLLPVLVKSNDDLRQEQLASQIIHRMALILARERIPVWLCPYEILALTDRGGIIEAIPDTISIASLKRNDPNYTNLHDFFQSFFIVEDDLADAKANFCESMAGYSIVCFLLQIKDRHNGNILLDSKGHLIHIDFGFFFLSSPGKNTGFESAPFKLNRDMVEVMGGPESRLFKIFRNLCVRAFLALRKHCMELILLVEMIQKGNEHLACFRGRPEDAIRELEERFRLDLNDRACVEYVNALIDESLENWRTDWYDRYQRYCVGVL